MEIFNEIYQLLQDDSEAVLCIITHTEGSAPRKAGSKMLVFPDGSIKGTIGGGSIEYQAIRDAATLFETQLPIKKTYHLEEDLNMKCGGSVEVYFEPLKTKPKLHIFGAGHIGRVVAKYAHDFGFRVSIIDNRENIFSEFDNRNYIFHCDDYFRTIENLEFNERTYSVVVTPNHEYDEKITALLATKPFAYIGMIGSLRKVGVVRKNLKEVYGISDDVIQKIDMPVGIPFRAETPEEISLSIVAKLIDVKNSLKP